MSNEQDLRWSRREVLGGLAVAGTAALIGQKSVQVAGALLGLRSQAAGAEPPPETPTLRLGWNRRPIDVCFAPYFYAEEFLRQEGFTDVQWITSGGMDALIAGEVDLRLAFVGPLVRSIDAGAPIVILAGQQVGCYMLFVNDPIRAVRDLKGRTIASGPPGSGSHLFLSSLLAYVGLDPGKDVNVVSHPDAQARQMFTEGKLDAFLVFSGAPPTAQELQAKKIGRVLLNTMTDRPWSQYFCCMANGNREFVRKHPVATKRALRALLKATDIVAREPARVAKFLVAKGYTDRYDYALQILREIPFDRWREYNHEDTVRFYALRLHEVDIIKKTPLQIIAQGTDWRFLNELKKELKR